ncbi:hypothetical protein ACXYUI_32010, partial [Klebsiella pneumoniae]
AKKPGNGLPLIRNVQIHHMVFHIHKAAGLHTTIRVDSASATQETAHAPVAIGIHGSLAAHLSDGSDLPPSAFAIDAKVGS